MQKLRVGIIGCGQISHTYMTNLTGKFSKYVDLVACSDLFMDKARERAEEFSIAAREMDEFFASEDIDLIVVLTNAPAHGQTCERALLAGKHVYVEKPVCAELHEAKRLLELAEEKNLLFGCAPETFMGAGLQTARKLLNDGWIGAPIAAVASMRRLILDSVPEWVYQKGAGPLFDMGPYYITALVSLLGPVRSVKAFAKSPYEKRVVTDREGKAYLMPSDVDTYIAGVMEFENGAIASVTTTFDIWDDAGYQLEINGREGTLKLPDPNTFGGPVKLYGRRAAQTVEIPLTHGFSENCRGIGVADMAYSLLNGIPHAANGQMGTHVLEIMTALIESSRRFSDIVLQTTFTQLPPLPANYEQILTSEVVLS